MNNFIINDFKDEVEDTLRRWERKEDFEYYTSGSTGTPKKVIHSYEVIKKVSEEVVRQYNYTKDSYIYSIHPIGAIGGATLSVIPALIANCTFKIKKFNAKTYIDDLISGPTHTVIIPAIYRVMSKTKKWKNADFSSINSIICGSDMIPEGMSAEVISKGAKQFKMVYGSTEVPPSITNSIDERNVGSDLSPLIDYYFGDDGELFVKWNFQKNYWQSGDIFNEQFEIVGRKKNILKIAGCNAIHPEMCEKYILDNCDVTKVLLQVKNNKPHLYFEGNASQEEVKKILDDWYFSDITKNVVQKVTEIKTNEMNKIIREQIFTASI